MEQTISALSSVSFKRVYIEITNCCNLACSFCPGTKRAKRFMTPGEFRVIAEKIRPHTEYIYLHVMGEPLLHPDLALFLDIAGEYGFKVNLTTNGTLLSRTAKLLTDSPAVRKISISLHSFEGNPGLPGGAASPGSLSCDSGSAGSPTRDNIPALKQYLDSVLSLLDGPHPIIALRLWNSGGADTMNSVILEELSERFGTRVTTDDLARQNDQNGIKLGDRIYVESAEKFDWPSTDAKLRDVAFCHGLTQQIAILCDGSVVPCCLDSDGSVTLGNLLDSGETLEHIVSSRRARDMINGFRKGKPSEELCRRCGFAERFK